MAFQVGAEKYDRFMGRFSRPLASEFIALVDPRTGSRAIDVGCGPGALTAILVDRLGLDSVAAIDPSESFIDAVHDRFPGLDARVAAAEHVPYGDDEFDLAVAQLVVHFMADPVAALREMGRVTKPGGLIAASVWDFEGDRSPLSTFWQVVHELDSDAPGESYLAGVGRGQLVDILRAAGLSDVQEHTLTISVTFAGFDELWEPYTFGVGPAGDYVAKLEKPALEELIGNFAARFPSGPFTVDAAAWAATGRTGN